MSGIRALRIIAFMSISVGIGILSRAAWGFVAFGILVLIDNFFVPSPPAAARAGRGGKRNRGAVTRSERAAIAQGSMGLIAAPLLSRWTTKRSTAAMEVHGGGRVECWAGVYCLGSPIPVAMAWRPPCQNASRQHPLCTQFTNRSDRLRQRPVPADSPLRMTSRTTLTATALLSGLCTCSGQMSGNRGFLSSSL